MREAAGELGQQADFLEGLLNLVLTVGIILVHVMVDNAFRDNIVDLGAFVEGSHGILEDHLAAADDFHVFLLGDLSADPLSLVEDFTLGGGIDADDRAADGRFAGAGLADQCKCLALVNGEIDIVHSHELSAAVAKRHLQVLDLNERLAVRILMRMIQLDVGGLAEIRILQLLDGIRLRDLRCARVHQPGLGLVRCGDIIHRRLFEEVDVQGVAVAGCKRVALDLVEEVGRRAINGRQFLTLDAQLRQGAQESPGVGMMRIKEDFIGKTGLNDLSCVHDRYTVSHIGHNTQVMGDINDGHVVFTLQGLDEFQDLCLNRHVQSSGRFVADQDLRLAGHGDSDDSSLAHAAGEFMRILAIAHFRVRDADARKQADGFFLGSLAPQALMQFDRFTDLQSDLFQGVQAGHGVLCHHGNLLAADLLPFPFGLELGQVKPVVHDGAVCDLSVLVEHAHKELGEHALAGTGLTHNREGLPFIEVQGAAADSLQLLAAERELDLNILC